MINFFTVEFSTTGSFSDADRIADAMRVVVAKHDVRLLPVRKLSANVFLFAYAGCGAMAPQTIVSELRRRPQFAQYRIGDERSSNEVATSAACHVPEH